MCVFVCVCAHGTVLYVHTCVTMNPLDNSFYLRQSLSQECFQIEGAKSAFFTDNPQLRVWRTTTHTHTDNYTQFPIWVKEKCLLWATSSKGHKTRDATICSSLFSFFFSSFLFPPCHSQCEFLCTLFNCLMIYGSLSKLLFFQHITHARKQQTAVWYADAQPTRHTVTKDFNLHTAFPLLYTTTLRLQTQSWHNRLFLISWTEWEERK